MSINHQYSQEQPERLRQIDPTHSNYKDPIHHPFASAMHHHNASLNFNLNIQQKEEKGPEPQIRVPTNHETQLPSTIIMLQKEPMFEKPLTPSDVGKLNRLVIPKQHAERYFPLAANYDSLDKALLLSFEDESGKSWRFRYSYWNSSQSYVLTKGWSRFVKEKRLDAGDVVIFLRYRQEGDRFFIGWRRRNAVAPPPVRDIVMVQAGMGGAGGWARVLYNSGYPTGADHLLYQLPDSCLHAGLNYEIDDGVIAGGGVVGITGVGGGRSGGVEKERKRSGNSKTVRLFGVNLECQAQATDEIDQQPPTPSAEAFTHYYHNYSNKPHDDTPTYYYTNLMDMSFCGDLVNQRRHYQPG